MPLICVCVCVLSYKNAGHIRSHTFCGRAEGIYIMPEDTI